jgi:hypothetical protein
VSLITFVYLFVAYLNMLVESVMIYGAEVWDSNRKNRNKL